MRFRITGVLALGGQSIVYSAYDEEKGERVAVKMERPGPLESRGRRLEKEAEVLAAVHSRHVVGFRGAGFDPDCGQFVLVEELLRGTSLSTLLDGGDRPGPGVALEMIRQIASGLEALHKAGFIMRDLSPDQVVIHPAASVKCVLVDLGLTRRMALDTGLTAPGAVAGTPGFVAPELLTDVPASTASDTYSLAALAYLLLTGESPFPDLAPETVLALQAAGEAPEPELSHDLPAESQQQVRELFQRSLSADPACRPQSPADFSRQLEAAYRPRTGLTLLDRLLGRKPATEEPDS